MWDWSGPDRPIIEEVKTQVGRDRLKVGRVIPCKWSLEQGVRSQRGLVRDLSFDVDEITIWCGSCRADHTQEVVDASGYIDDHFPETKEREQGFSWTNEKP